MLIIAAGAVTDTYEYDAFGNLISHSGTTPNVYLYRGERYDFHLGLYYLRARWYNPVTGRFTTRDPYQGSIYDPASLHRYNYARSNPANFVDPSGRLSAGECGEVALNTLKNSYALTAYQFVQNCTIYAIASSVQLVGEKAGLHIDQLWTNFKGCSATITASNFGRAWLANTALLGLGEGLGALGEWLDGAEQGAGLEPGLNCGLCFAAGTPVHTDHGSVPIERIKVGDKVWAHNEKTGVNELRTVTAVAPQHRDTLLELHIEGEKNALRATPVHPFYARRGASDIARWIDAGDLVAGEQIETQDGRWVTVLSVTPVQGLSVVYNFTVEEDHDYFVGDEGLLVHNAGVCPTGTLDWTRPRFDGATTSEHVLEHGVDNPLRQTHGVFADDPIATTEQAWRQAVQDGIQPTVGGNGNLNYSVPYPEAGLQGGQVGNAAGNPILNSVRIVTTKIGNPSNFISRVR